MTTVHQLLPTFRDGDATSQAAVDFSRALEERGRHGRIYAQDATFTERVRPASELSVSPDDWVLYHHGIASELAGRLLRLSCRRAVVFHNISPESHYAGTNLAYALRTGRAQLAAMAPFVSLGIGVSTFNAAELKEAGFRHVDVVPLAVEAERFAADQAEDAWLRRLAPTRGIAGPEQLRPNASGRRAEQDGKTSPRLLSVGRLVAHKCIQDVLRLHEAVLRLRPAAQLFIVGGYDAGSAYFRGLEAQARALSGVRLLGRVSHSALVACYRSADLFISMSEHEGFGVPLVEAMACDVPVLAYGAAAVPSTLDGAGVCFDRKDFTLLAELAVELSNSAALRRKILTGQRRRLGQLTLALLGQRLLSALTQSEQRDLRRVG